uniref:non-specific serine/threonine protein kinase n=1 Tax=Glossina brevipalpis TaxID=37001 RepID=A0A1A9X0J1_9MUSC
MTHTLDAISVRTTRLNNVLLGSGRCYGVSAAFCENMTREGLLDAFCLLYNECDKEALRKRDKNILEFVNKYRNIVDETRRLRVSVQDFNVRNLIGQGYFGNVNLVVEHQTRDVYAMKKIKKSVVTTSQVKVERDIMSRRCSDWITNLQYAFQDKDYLYLIMEYLPGGDLLSLMSRHGSFDEDLTRFYLAEMTMAIHALHEMGYVHRDIKPENILIDRFGHIKLADFGNSAALDRDGHVFSLSPVGTPDYIAPELLQTISTYKLTKNMHDVSCDYWSMGIIGYELVCEITPFYDDNVHETYSKILSHCEESQLKELITFPTELKLTPHFQDLIKSLLTNPSNRLGYEGLRKHTFFSNIEWDNFRSSVPPIIPTLKSEDDTSNFEDITRNKTRAGAAAGFNAKKSLTATMTSNDFCGKDLPFIGYSFVHMERQEIEQGALEDARYIKLNNKFKDLQHKHKERLEDISQLKQELLRAELTVKQSDTQSKLLQDAKDEMNKMKDIIKQKNAELANCRTEIKTLKSSLRIEKEVGEKKDASITEILRSARQKYEDALNENDRRYEKKIAEKKAEVSDVLNKLDEREIELSAKAEECLHLQEKMENYKELVRQHKEQVQNDREEFEKHKMHITETYEQKLLDLRNKLRLEKNSKSRLTMELRDVRTELDDSINVRRNSEEAKLMTAKTTEEILQRLNREIESNNELHKTNADIEQKLNEARKTVESLQQEIQRLERDLQVAECSKNLAESALATPFETAPGSLTDICMIEEQLRADLEVAKENENVQKMRANKLQEVVGRLEEMLERFNEQSPSPTKPLAAPRQVKNATTADDLLEKQNEKLEDKLATVREQMIVERQAARTANLSLWKMEKLLEEVKNEKNTLQRRLQLTEDRIKKAQNDREDALRSCKLSEEAKVERGQRIEELKQEISALKKDVKRGHETWEKAERERMKCKTEVIEHISNTKRLEESLAECRHKLRQTQEKCEKLESENKCLIGEISEEKDRHMVTADQVSSLQIQLKSHKDNYERLKYACIITDNQMTEIEAMLEKEQESNKTKQQKLEQLLIEKREKFEIEAELRKQLCDEKSQKQMAELNIRNLSNKLEEQRQSLEYLQQELGVQKQQLALQTTALFATQESFEVLQSEKENVQTLNGNYQREIILLKEENTRILSDLFHAKEGIHQSNINLKDALTQIADLQNELEDARRILGEKESFYLQREIKSETTLAQHKKLIDYLQLKVEDLSQKKKKTFADKLFGSSYHANSSTFSASNRKENLCPNAIENSIVYRTLQEELKREKSRNKTLQEQLDKFQKNGNSGKSPLKKAENQVQTIDNSQGMGSNKTVSRNTTKSSFKTEEIRQQQPGDCDVKNSKGKLHKIPSNDNAKYLQLHHRFELALQEADTDASECAACHKPVLAGSPSWKCKECKRVAHRRCRGDVKVACGGIESILSGNAVKFDCIETMAVEPSAPTRTDLDIDSLSKYSYEAKLDDQDGANVADFQSSYNGSLIFTISIKNEQDIPLEVSCAYEMEENRILLLGCNTGLYAYHVKQQHLVHIAGIDAVNCIAISEPLAKAILVGSNGESLYQCDLRHLRSRSQANACLKLALEASVLDLSFANRGTAEKWQLVQVSEETEQPLDTVAIAATLSRIVILKYDVKQQKFKPVRALDTATSVSSMLFTRHTAIVSSDKFFEIDLSTYGAEEFIDIADQSLSHTSTCQPIVALRITKQEFLLCFMECGVFVDEYGCRSRPYDIGWGYTPTGFMYRAPFLYVAHFQSVQIMRVHRSYSKEMTCAPHKDVDADRDDAIHELKKIHLPFYMPTMLCNSGKHNIYMLAMQKDTGTQQIYHLDALQIFKHQYNNSQDTISSVTTSITMGSLTTTLSTD